LLLLELEGGDGAAREVVVDAAIVHGRPVAHLAAGEGGAVRTRVDQLLEGLRAVEDAFGGMGDDVNVVRVNDQHVAFGADRLVEGELFAAEDVLG
jgi:hypothetical protein